MYCTVYTVYFLMHRPVCMSVGRIAGLKWLCEPVYNKWIIWTFQHSVVKCYHSYEASPEEGVSLGGGTCCQTLQCEFSLAPLLVQTSPASYAQSNRLILSSHSTREFNTIQQLQTNISLLKISSDCIKGEPGFSIRMHSVICLFGAFIVAAVFHPGMSVNL